VGTVAEVKRDPAQSLADVDVKPAAALDRSRELLFVWLKPQAAEVLAPIVAPAPATTRGSQKPPATASKPPAGKPATDKPAATAKPPVPKP
jgi:hypothetical protein